MTREELADYITWNAAALTVELGEFLAETGWKPWITNRGWVNRDAALGELVDVGHFLANLLCAIGVTDSEWELMYQAKQGENRRRQEAGYDGVTDKCPSCKRDKAVAEQRMIGPEPSIICPCGYVWHS